MILSLVELNKLNKEGEEHVPKTRDVSFKHSTRLIVLALAETQLSSLGIHATLSSPVLPPPPKEQYRTTHSQLQMPAQLQGRRSVLAALNLV
jgi:hypothetical protein